MPEGRTEPTQTPIPSLWPTTSPSTAPTSTLGPTSNPPPSPPDCPTQVSEPLFEVSLVQMSDIRGIVPLGNLNPSGHALPSPHIYFYIRMTEAEPLIPAFVPVFAPVHIWITSIEYKQYSNPISSDYTLKFKPCNQFSGYYHHVQDLSDDLLERAGPFEGSACGRHSTASGCRKSVMIEMQAGELIGAAGGEGHLAMDFGAMDGRVPPLAYANPAHFWADPSGLDRFHLVCPIDYYAPEVRDWLRGRLGDFEGKNPRTVEPICGEVEQDEPGTAQGTWYLPSAPSFPEAPHLNLVHSNIDPALGAFSIGSLVPGLESIAHYFHPETSGRVNLDFSLVTTDANVYCYDSMFGLAGHPVSPAEIILIQLTNEGSLRFEKRDAAECGTGPWDIASNFAEFER